MATNSSIEWTESTWNPLLVAPKSAQDVNIVMRSVWLSGCKRWGKENYANGLKLPCNSICWNGRYSWQNAAAYLS